MYQELLKIIETNLLFVSAKIINVKFRYMYADLKWACVFNEEVHCL